VEEKYMEISIDRKEFQKISLEFRRLSSRLLKTYLDDGMDNLKRLLNFIENTPLIWDFIAENNIAKFNMKDEIEKREFLEGYNIPIEKSDEIAYVYQLLKYCTENCGDYLGICMYYSSSRTLQDHIDSFNDRVVNSWISHIEVYLREKLIDMGDNEKISITVNGGQVAIAQDDSTVYATQNNNLSPVEDINTLSVELIKLINLLDIEKEKKEETKEIIEAAVEEVNSEKPKKSIIKYAITKVEDVTKLGAGVVGLLTTSKKAIEVFSNIINR
jgi:hypothetical protein